MPYFNMPDDFSGFPWDNEPDIEGETGWRVAPDSVVQKVNETGGTLVSGTVRECWSQFGNHYESWYTAVYEGCEKSEFDEGFVSGEVLDYDGTFIDWHGAESVWELDYQPNQSMSDFADSVAEVSTDWEYWYLMDNAEIEWYIDEPDLEYEPDWQYEPDWKY